MSHQHEALRARLSRLSNVSGANGFAAPASVPSMTLQSESQFSSLAATVQALQRARTVLESGHHAPLKTGALSAAVRKGREESLVAAAGGTSAQLRRSLKSLAAAAASASTKGDDADPLPPPSLASPLYTARVHEPFVFAPLSEQLRELSSSPLHLQSKAEVPTARPVTAQTPSSLLGGQTQSTGARVFIAPASLVRRFDSGRGIFVRGSAAKISAPPPLPPRPEVSPVKVRKVAAT